MNWIPWNSEAELEFGSLFWNSEIELEFGSLFWNSEIELEFGSLFWDSPFCFEHFPELIRGGFPLVKHYPRFK